MTSRDGNSLGSTIWHRRFTQIQKIRNNISPVISEITYHQLEDLGTYAAPKILTTIFPVGQPNIEIAPKCHTDMELPYQEYPSLCILA